MEKQTPKINPVEHTILKITGDTYTIFIITKKGRCLLPNIAGPRKRDFFDIRIKNKMIREADAAMINENFSMYSEVTSNIENSKYYML